MSGSKKCGGFSTLSRWWLKLRKDKGTTKDEKLTKSSLNLSHGISTTSLNIQEASHYEETKNRIASKPAVTSNTPFEQTFRITVLLPKDQLFVTRLGARVPLSALMHLVCESKLLDPDKYEFRSSVNLNEVYSCDMTIGSVGLSEIRLCYKSEPTVVNGIECGNTALSSANANIRSSLSSSEFSSQNSKHTTKTASPCSLRHSLSSLNSKRCLSLVSPPQAQRTTRLFAPPRKKRAAPHPPSMLSRGNGRQDSISNSISISPEIINDVPIAAGELQSRSYFTSTPNLSVNLSLLAAETQESIVQGKRSLAPSPSPRAAISQLKKPAPALPAYNVVKSEQQLLATPAMASAPVAAAAAAKLQDEEISETLSLQSVSTVAAAIAADDSSNAADTPDSNSHGVDVGLLKEAADTVMIAKSQEKVATDPAIVHVMLATEELALKNTNNDVALEDQQASLQPNDDKRTTKATNLLVTPNGNAEEASQVVHAIVQSDAANVACSESNTTSLEPNANANLNVEPQTPSKSHNSSSNEVSYRRTEYQDLSVYGEKNNEAAKHVHKQPEQALNGVDILANCESTVNEGSMVMLNGRTAETLGTTSKPEAVAPVQLPAKTHTMPPKKERHVLSPSINVNLATWHERPKSIVAIKNEGDYIYGGRFLAQGSQPKVQPEHKEERAAPSVSKVNTIYEQRESKLRPSGIVRPCSRIINWQQFTEEAASFVPKSRPVTYAISSPVPAIGQSMLRKTSFKIATAAALTFPITANPSPPPPPPMKPKAQRIAGTETEEVQRNVGSHGLVRAKSECVSASRAHNAVCDNRADLLAAIRNFQTKSLKPTTFS